MSELLDGSSVFPATGYRVIFPRVPGASGSTERTAVAKSPYNEPRVKKQREKKKILSADTSSALAEPEAQLSTHGQKTRVDLDRITDTLSPRRSNEVSKVTVLSSRCFR